MRATLVLVAFVACCTGSSPSPTWSGVYSDTGSAGQPTIWLCAAGSALMFEISIDLELRETPSFSGTIDEARANIPAQSLSVPAEDAGTVCVSLGSGTLSIDGVHLTGTIPLTLAAPQGCPIQSSETVMTETDGIDATYVGPWSACAD